MEGSKSESMSGGCSRGKTDGEAKKGQQTEAKMQAACTGLQLHKLREAHVSPTVYLGQSYIIH